MINRREFLKLSGASAAAAAALRLKLMRAWAAIQGGSLDPGDVTKYALPLVIPPAMPMQSKAKQHDFYKIAVRQFQQQILPAPHPMTTRRAARSADGGVSRTDHASATR